MPNSPRLGPPTDSGTLSAATLQGWQAAAIFSQFLSIQYGNPLSGTAGIPLPAPLAPPGSPEQELQDYGQLQEATDIFAKANGYEWVGPLPSLDELVSRTRTYLLNQAMDHPFSDPNLGLMNPFFRDLPALPKTPIAYRPIPPSPASLAAASAFARAETAALMQQAQALSAQSMAQQSPNQQINRSPFKPPPKPPPPSSSPPGVIYDPNAVPSFGGAPLPQGLTPTPKPPWWEDPDAALPKGTLDEQYYGY